MAKTLQMAKKAREAACVLGTLSHDKRNAALLSVARNLERDAEAICRANRRDVLFARKAGLSTALVKRLELNPSKVRKIAEAAHRITRLPDPVGRVLGRTVRPNGLQINKVSVPLGVLLIIFESRPNVTVDCAALGLKSGNAVILKGGREAFYSNRALHASIQKALKARGLPAAAVTLIPSTDRRTARDLLSLNAYIDLVIPRGGEALIRAVARESRIPVVKHYKGVCHVYVDRRADLDMALNIAENAKVQNPGVCNAMETLLVHRDAAPRFLPAFGRRMRAHGVEIRGCPVTRRFLEGARPAREADWNEEYLDLILAVRVVKSLDEAVDHIRRYGSAHTDTIVSRDRKAIETFIQKVDSACVFANASTRFADGGEFGMGAEVGISTDKLHARGPMGLNELTTYKYVVRGKGQIRV